ncbi:MAG: DNA repair protein RadC [Bacteroidetes bacterium]|nr:DNA repair protein RadC [Bacteroidota bacterium]
MQAKNYPIHEWAEDDRPREKLLRKKPTDLSDSELLAILINKGTLGKSAIDLAREILQLGHSDLNRLARLSIRNIMTVKGVGKAKASSIIAALELGRRRQGREMKESRLINSHQIKECFRALLKDLNREVFAALYLSLSNRVLGMRIIGEGGISATIADPRLVLRGALELSAVKIVLCHNHPSGNLRPSEADDKITLRILKAAEVLDLKLVDHIIVSTEGYYSFADNERIITS